MLLFTGILNYSTISECWCDSFILLPANGCCLRQCLSVVLLSGLFLWRTTHCQGTGDVNGFISFAQPSLVVDEGPSTQTFTTVSIPLIREGGTSGNVFVTITVSLQGSILVSLCLHVLDSYIAIAKLIICNLSAGVSISLIMACCAFYLLYLHACKFWLNLFMLFVRS